MMSVKGQSSSSTTPFYGFLFTGMVSERRVEPENGTDTYFRIYYVSLEDLQFSNSRISDWRKTETEAAENEAVLHEPTYLNFSYLLAEYKSICTTHRGLILIRLRTTYTYHVYNPSNRQICRLPSSPSLPEDSEVRTKKYFMENAAIVNFSTAERNFKVIRIYRSGKGRRAEVYSSNSHEWNDYGLNRNDPATIEKIWELDWDLTSAVFVNDTLYFLAGSEHKYVVGVNVPSTDNQISVVRSLHLPQPIPDGTDIVPALHVSQGCLYISYAKSGYVGIWRLDDHQGWSQVFIFDRNSPNNPPSNPHIVHYLDTKYMEDDVDPLNMHPEKPIVYLHRKPFIVAFNISNNDEVEEITLERDPIFFPVHFHLFSPCSVPLSQQEASNST